MENARRIIKVADGKLHINTAEFVLRRDRAALAEPVGEGPSELELEAIELALWDKYRTKGWGGGEFMYDNNFSYALEEYRAALARWGRPAAAPVPEPGELQWPASVAQGCHEAAAEAESGSPLQQLLVAAGDLLERGRPAAAPVPEPSEVRELLATAGVFKGSHGIEGLLNADAFWEQQPYGTRLYYGDGIADYLHRGVLRSAVTLLQQISTPSLPN